MNSATTNYSKYILSAKSNNLKITIIEGQHFGGWKCPPGGHKNFFGVKITSKMNSVPSNYSECKISAKSNNF